MTQSEHFEVVVIGGGSGLTAAYHAERDDRRIALITDRPDAMGGTCINFGCIPTKTLITSARAVDAVRSAHRFGVHVDTESLSVDFPGIMSRMRRARAESAHGAREWVERSMTLFSGRARFVDASTIVMADGRRLSGDQFFIATGSRPSIPPIEGLSALDYWTHADVLECTEAPARLIVIGGGYIGTELAYFFAAMGTAVTLVHPRDTLLAEDEEIGKAFTAYFDERIARVTGRARAVWEKAGIKHVRVERGPGDDCELAAEALLVATGRTPNTTGLGLAAAGVACDEAGSINVDAHLATSAPNIHAYGDVIGVAPFKHTSSREGEIAYRHAFGGHERMNWQANPHAVFSSPEVAGVGLTEAQCRERGVSVRINRLAYTDVARGAIEQAEAGLAKLILDADDRILGCHIVGPDAALLIQEVVVAMNSPDAAADPVRRAIHVHPSLSELIGTLFDNA